MARVSISVNGYAYDIACADGEEQHILDLAEALDAKVGELVGAIGQAGEARLLAMAGLLLADETNEAREAAARAKAELDAERDAPTQPQTQPQNPGVDEARLAGIMDALAARIESIAQRLEHP